MSGLRFRVRHDAAYDDEDRLVVVEPRDNPT